MVEKREAPAICDDVILKIQLLSTLLSGGNGGEERSSSIGDDVILKGNFSPSCFLVEKRGALACSDPDSFGDDLILKDQFLYTTLPDDNCGEERSYSIGDDVIRKYLLLFTPLPGENGGEEGRSKTFGYF
jgi:hypothetical protein